LHGLNLAAQYDSSTSRSIVQTDYLRKSRHQKTAAWILLGAGSSIIAAGFITANNVAHPENPTATVGPAFLAIWGLIGDLASIPFFISSGKNKRRAAAIGFKYEPYTTQGNFASCKINSLNLKISF
jgi:hypothetical protein